MIMVQDIPIRVLNDDSIHGIIEPIIPDTDVHIMLPPLLSLKSIIERMKSISIDHVLAVSANMNGELRLRVMTDTVTVETFYKNLVNPDLSTSFNCKNFNFIFRSSSC